MSCLNEFTLILLKFVEWDSSLDILCFHDDQVAIKSLIYNFDSAYFFFLNLSTIYVYNESIYYLVFICLVYVCNFHISSLE